MIKFLDVVVLWGSILMGVFIFKWSIGMGLLLIILGLLISFYLSFKEAESNQ